jgi:GTP cyclohydrolase I
MTLLWGDLMQTEGMVETPERVAKHWTTITKGLHQDPLQPLMKTFSCDSEEIVLETELQFSSLCEHHLLPFTGVAHVGYIPKGRVVGLSKIPRCLDILSARPQLQERLTLQLATAIQTGLNAEGVIVVIEAEHSCMSTRGINKPGSKTTTTATLGLFKQDPVKRSEALSLIQQTKR